MKGKRYEMNIIEKRIKRVASVEDFLNAMKEEYYNYNWEQLDGNNVGFSVSYTGDANGVTDKDVALVVGFGFQPEDKNEVADDEKVRLTIIAKTYIDNVLKNTSIEKELNGVNAKNIMARIENYITSVNNGWYNLHFLTKTAAFMKEQFGDDYTKITFTKK